MNPIWNVAAKDLDLPSIAIGKTHEIHSKAGRFRIIDINSGPSINAPENAIQGRSRRFRHIKKDSQGSPHTTGACFIAAFVL
jgi:hypothetical protein